MPRRLDASNKSHGMRRAARAFGSYAEMAKRLKLTPGAICRWNRIPEKYLLKIESLTGVRRQDLRPDLYN